LPAVTAPTRRLLFATAISFILALGAVAAFSLTRPGDAEPPILGSFGGRPLPPGPPNLDGGGAVSVERVATDRLIDEAAVVFVGRVEAIGGSEVVSPGRPAAFGIHSSHRTRFRVDEQLRGARAAKIDVSVLDVPEFAVFEVGHSYLVFAEWRDLGTARRRALVPAGYFQGVFMKETDDRWINQDNGVVTLKDLRARTQLR
jgi:hypothetical protein